MLTWEQIRQWRKEQRAALIERRLAISGDDRVCWSQQIATRILREFAMRRPTLLGFYWPFKGEFDPRGVAEAMHGQGIGLALPVVVQTKAPLVFRAWQPGAPLVSGVWGIPVPADGKAVLPDTLLVPLVGCDEHQFRLGYGGGFYDRTMAAMPRRPLTIGVGFSVASIETIHPQTHDIPMDIVITEAMRTP